MTTDENSTERWRDIYGVLKRRIQTLELPPGAQLSEASVAAQFGVSASPVRDALGRLSQEGLLTLRRRKGYTVIPLTVGSVRDIVELRFVIESGAVRFAIERAKDSDVIALLRLAKRTGSASSSAEDIINANKDFHLAVARLGGSPRVVEVLERVLDESSRIFYLGLPAFTVRGMHENHIALLEAIRAHDEAAAIDICHKEAYDTLSQVLKSLVTEGGQESGLMLRLSP